MGIHPDASDTAAFVANAYSIYGGVVVKRRQAQANGGIPVEHTHDSYV
jgi:hypothetical protein